jgi:hypothetical protein
MRAWTIAAHRIVIWRAVDERADHHLIEAKLAKRASTAVAGQTGFGLAHGFGNNDWLRGWLCPDHGGKGQA